MRTSNIIYTLKNIETGEINESNKISELCKLCDFSRPDLSSILKGTYDHKSKFSKKFEITSRPVPKVIKVKPDKYEITIVETGEVKLFKNFKDMSKELNECISKLNDILNDKRKSKKYIIKKINL